MEQKLGMMKIERKNVSENPWVIVENIKKAINITEEIGNVRFDFLNSSGSSWHTKFGGVILTIYDNDYHAIQRRVLVSDKKKYPEDSQNWEREYSIDLDKIRKKYDELVELKKRLEIKAEESRKNARELADLMRRFEQGLKNVHIEKGFYSWKITISELSQNYVEKIVEFVKQLYLGDKKDVQS